MTAARESAQLSLDALPVAAPALDRARGRERLLRRVLGILRTETWGGLPTADIARRARLSVPRTALLLRELAIDGAVDRSGAENVVGRRFAVWCERAPGKAPVIPAWSPARRRPVVRP